MPCEIMRKPIREAEGAACNLNHVLCVCIMWRMLCQPGVCTCGVAGGVSGARNTWSRSAALSVLVWRERPPSEGGADGGGASGGAHSWSMVKWKDDPTPCSDSTQMVPPISSASRRDIARPSPVASV